MQLDRGNIIARKARGASMQNVIIGLLGMIAVFVVAVVSLPFLRGFFGGPRALAPEHIYTEQLAVLPHNWVQATGLDVENTGWYSTTQRTRRGVPQGDPTVSSTFFIMEVSTSPSRGIVVEVPGDYEYQDDPDPNFTGVLRRVNTSEVDTNTQEILNEINADMRGSRMQLLPFMIEVTDFRSNGYIGLAIGLGVLGLSIYLFYRGMDYMEHPEKTAPYKALASYPDPVQAANEIDQGMKARPTKVGYASFLPDWLVHHGGSPIKFARYDDLMWVYPKTHTVKYYGLIPIFKSLSVMVKDRYGQELEFACRGKKQMETLMASIAQRNSWALYGYDERTEQQWNTYRAECIAAIDSRRAQRQTV